MPKSAEELRAQLVKDPKTKDIAKTLGMELDAYVALVIDYALHPEKKPQLNVISEADAKAAGAATTGDVKAWLQQQLDAAGARTQPPKDEFEEAKKKK